MTSSEKHATSTSKPAKPELEIALLTGGWDKPYAFGLAKALSANGVCLDLIGSDDLMREFRGEPNITCLAFRRESGANAALIAKMIGVLGYYGRLIRYAFNAKPRVFHILWNNKFETIDRVVLTLYYRLLGKKIVLTAHNVNAGTRDANDTLVNRVTLKIQYALSSHIFVHTEKMKSALVDGFGLPPAAVTVVPFGINNAVPQTALTREQARQRLGLNQSEKAVLFFGNIAPYKGLEYLVDAFLKASRTPDAYRLIVAGRPKKGFEAYWEAIRSSIGDKVEKDGLILKIQFIPDDDTEVYFKAADVLALPYSNIFQSGVLVLGYSFGLPVLAADVGSLREDIVEGSTGFVFAPRNAEALADAITMYFRSELFQSLDERRREIRAYAEAKYSWGVVADTTQAVYARLLAAPSLPPRSLPNSGPTATPSHGNSPHDY